MIASLDTIFVYLLPAVIVVASLFFAFQALSQVATEVASLSAGKVILVRGSCPVTVLDQSTNSQEITVLR